MKFHLTPTTANVVTGFGVGWVRIGAQEYRESVVVTPDSLIKAGNALFSGAGCIGCHAMVGTPLAGTTSLKGPNLSHVGSRTTIVANMLQNTPENLRKWLSNPDSVKKGTLMVLPRKLTDAEIATLVAYLRAHK